MYLSKLTVKSGRLMDPYTLHREMWKIFPEDPVARRNFLYRADYDRHGAPKKILLQSCIKPVDPQNGPLRIENGPKEFALKVSQSQFLRFTLRANPVKRLNHDRNRVPLVDEDDLNQWLERKLSATASLEETSIVGKHTLYFRKGRHRGKIATVTFSGVISVTDSEKLVELVKTGIGSAKAFGCGLLSLARA